MSFPKIFWITLAFIIFNWPLISASTEQADVFLDQFTEISNWNIETHQNGKVVDKKIYDISFTKNSTDGGIINYNYATPGEDAVMISRAVSISSGNSIELSVRGDEQEHLLFVVFEDASGEKHFLHLGMISGNKIINRKVDFSFLLKSPGLDIESIHYGGDKNQKIDYPIKKITIGISDEKDSNKGSGLFTIYSVKIE